MKFNGETISIYDEVLHKKEMAIKHQWKKEARERNRQLKESQKQERLAHQVYVACLARELADMRREMREQGYIC